MPDWNYHFFYKNESLPALQSRPYLDPPGSQTALMFPIVSALIAAGKCVQIIEWSFQSSFAVFQANRILLMHVVFAFPTVRQDRKSTRLNSSHVKISYAVFCLKKKKKIK